MFLALRVSAALVAALQLQRVVSLRRAVAAAAADGGSGWDGSRESVETSQFTSYANSLDACDVTSAGLICFSGQRPALAPTGVPRGLVGHWTFDERSAIDSSGNGNHGATEILHGPSPAGGGHSAMFQQSYVVVPSSPQFQHADMSYSFWVYLLEDTAGLADDAPRHCPLLRKGAYVPKAEEFANAPAILFDHRTGRLRASMTTTASDRDGGEPLDSSARLVPGRWAHIALVSHGARRALLLYVNGILDATTTTRGAFLQNNFPLYVGGDPFTADRCKHTVYIDDLRVYDRTVAPHELQAEAAPALAGVDPSFVHLGCLSCSLPDAVQACPQGRHICSSLELHTGGYQVARSLGWLSAGAHVWTLAAVVKARNPSVVDVRASPPQFGLGLCCQGEE